MDAASTQLADVLSTEDAALGNRDPVGGQAILQVQGCIQADVEVVQVAVVDADERRIELQGTIEFGSIMDLDENIEVILACAGREFRHLGIGQCSNDEIRATARSCWSSDAMNDRTRIAVLGAGPMGLAVAYQLVLDGHQPVVFEADDRVGGMTATFDFGGLDIERYYHFHCISDHAFLKVLDELGLADRMRWTETRMGYWFQNRLQPWGNPMALLRFKGLGLMAKLRYGLHAFLSIRRDDWRPLDHVEATGWIKRWVGNEAYEVLWRKLFELKLDRKSNV